MSELATKIVTIDEALDSAAVPHAFGGALALAWCTERARGTIDIDLNLFVTVDEVDVVFEALPAGVGWSDTDVAVIVRDGQTRLWWDATPVDVFFSTTDFHTAAAGRARVETFGGRSVPFLGCTDLAVFKAFFDRTRDWADLEDMVTAGTLDADRVLGVLVRYLGGDDHRVARLRTLVAPGPPVSGA